MQLTFKKADQLNLMDQVLVEALSRNVADQSANRLMVGGTYVEDFKGGEFQTVTSLQLVGDDVIVNTFDGQFTTSQGNQFLVLV